jgi:calcium-activated chloride channel regulator 4
MNLSWGGIEMAIATNKKAFYRAVSGIAAAAVFLATVVQPVLAGGSWLSKTHQAKPKSESGVYAAGAESNETIFDIVISLYDAPAGDDDPTNDMGGEDQTPYENIVRFWADAVCEESNGQHKLGKVRFFSNGVQGSLADVVWNEREWPRASASGFGRSGKRITFGDIFPEGCGPSCDINFLGTAGRQEDAGYTLGHEWGHYVYGLYDEYEGSDASETRISFPQVGDTEPAPAIMNSQWNARSGTTNDFSWLNHTTSDNYEANTAQGRSYGASGWEVLLQSTDDDPKDGDRSTLGQRVEYTALDGAEPDAGDNWVIEELPGDQAICRNQLEMIWMQDDVEIQLALDRSNSMSGDPFTNATAAAKNLVDESADGNTALGVVSFGSTATQDQAIIAIPDPGDTTKTAIKDIIDGLSADGNTAMFDAADLALTNMLDYATTNSTDAAQIVFLLSDGVDTASSSSNQGAVTTAYQDADVPLITLAYGSFAPEGVLRELADDTGGFFRASPTSLNEVQSTLLAVKASFTSSSAISQTSRSAPASGSTDFNFAVDSTMKEVALFANYTGVTSDIDFSLSSPAGAVPLGFDCQAVATSTSCSGIVQSSTLQTQGTGSWALSASNTTGSAIAVNVDIIATPLPIRHYDLVVAPVGGSVVSYPTPLLLTAVTSERLPITGVNLAATITNPSGVTTSFSMGDAGTDGDGVAGDGIYSAILRYQENGIHTVKVDINNDSLNAAFTAEGLLPGHPSSTEAGGTPTPPVPPAITELFDRTSTIQVTVADIPASGDDHPNSVPGTPVTPNNADVPGIIDYAGDHDYFTVTTDSREKLVFRATGLSPDMVATLTVFAEDGVTELASGRSDQLIGDASYVALEVPVNGDSQLHARVVHTDDGLGTYLFSAGSRIFSDAARIAIDIKPGNGLNPINTGNNGVIPLAICNGNGIVNTVEINDPSVANGYGAASTNIDLESIRFGVDRNQAALGTTLAPPRHKLYQQATLAGHMTKFNGGTLMRLDAPACAGDPAGADLALHFETQGTGLYGGLKEACIDGRLENGVIIYGCDEVNAFDKDNDGVSDTAEASIFSTDLNNPDTDGDGLTDGAEIYGLNWPNQYTSSPTSQDTDGDWIKDQFEIGFLGTNPGSADTDGDTIPDFWEAIYWTNPTDANSANGNPDGDAYTNLQEYQNNTNPRVFDP